MFLLKKLFCFLFFIFLLLRKIKSLQNQLISDEIYFIKNEIYCIGESFLYFRDHLFKICAHDDLGDIEMHLYVQKRLKDSWTKGVDLLSYGVTETIFFSFVVNGKLLIVFCNTEYNINYDNNNCYVATSTTGDSFETQPTTIPKNLFSERSLTYYSSNTLNFLQKEYLLICGVYSFSIDTEEKNNFIRCAASDNEGKTWEKNFYFRYSNFNNSYSYFFLKPKFFKNETGFFYYVHNGQNIESNYIKCTYTNNDIFDCFDVSIDKQNKHLRDLIKINDNYITIISPNNLGLCYMYYTVENVSLINPSAYNDDKRGCYRSSLLDLNQSKIFFIYSSGNMIQNIHTYINLEYEE